MNNKQLIKKVRDAIRSVLRGIDPGGAPTITADIADDRLEWKHVSRIGEFGGYVNMSRFNPDDIVRIAAAQTALMVGSNFHPAGNNVRLALRSFDMFGPGVPPQHAAVLAAALQIAGNEIPSDPNLLIKNALPDIVALAEQVIKKVQDAGVHIPVRKGAQGNDQKEDDGSSPNGVPKSGVPGTDEAPVASGGGDV